MTPEEIGLILIAVLAAIVVPLFIIAIRRDLKKAPNRETIRAEEDALFDVEPEIMNIRAEVVDMDCGVNSVGYQGYKLPRAVKSFVISFKTKEGELLHLEVEEEYYSAFELGQTGELELINGRLASFEVDEA
jgi:hypothetical protein